MTVNGIFIHLNHYIQLFLAIFCQLLLHMHDFLICNFILLKVYRLS